MMPGAPPPEIPPPAVPPSPEAEPDAAPPASPVPLVVPADDATDDPVDRLRAARRLLLLGPLDHATVNRLCSELMLADGLSADPIELTINSPGGPADAVLGLIDVITLLRAPLATRSIGRATGTAAVVLASGTGGRSASAHALLGVRLDDTLAFDGRAADIQREAAAVTAVWDRIARHLATVSALTPAQATAALRDGDRLSPAEAISAGLIDEVAGADGGRGDVR